MTCYVYHALVSSIQNITVNIIAWILPLRMKVTIGKQAPPFVNLYTKKLLLTKLYKTYCRIWIVDREWVHWQCHVINTTITLIIPSRVLFFYWIPCTISQQWDERDDLILPSGRQWPVYSFMVTIAAKEKRINNCNGCSLIDCDRSNVLIIIEWRVGSRGAV